jgi:hypothetical protein
MRHREVPESASAPAAARGGGCAVKGCDKAPQRSQPRSRVAEALPELALEGGRRSPAHPVQSPRLARRTLVSAVMVAAQLHAPPALQR